MEMKAEEYCLHLALLIAITTVGNDPNYKAYRHMVQTLLETTGTDLYNGAGIPELVRF